MCLVETWKKMLWWWLVLRQEVGVLRIWDGVGGDASLISSVRIYIYYMGLLLVGSIIKFSLLIKYISIYSIHTSPPILSILFPTRYFFFFFAWLLSLALYPACLRQFQSTNAHSTPPFAPTSYYHSLISLTTPFYPFSPPPSPPLVLKYKKRRKRTRIASPARRVFCPRGEKADFIMWRKRRIQVEKKVWPSHHTIPSF